ncbi:MAG: hypothetical protein IPJ65_19700 [Archangiaceae bacterium]|nr:hypothetical protein [Archangiaceae bacterium]
MTASPSQLNGVPERLTSGSLARLSLSAASGVALDLRTRPLSTSVTVNGQAPTVAALADGGTAAPWAALVLTTPAGEEMAVQALECPIRSIGAQCPLTFRAPVYDGVSYRAALTGNGFRELPLTTAQPFQWSLTRRLPVPAPITVPAPPSLNVSTARLKGTVTLNGQTPMLSAADAGLGSSATVPVARLNLTRLDTGAATAVSLFCGAASAPGRCVLDFDTWVSPGVYRVGVEPLSSAVADTPVGARRRYQAYDAVELR